MSVQPAPFDLVKPLDAPPRIDSSQLQQLIAENAGDQRIQRVRDALLYPLAKCPKHPGGDFVAAQVGKEVHFQFKILPLGQRRADFTADGEDGLARQPRLREEHRSLRPGALPAVDVQP